jgi:hypothetical protein
VLERQYPHYFSTGAIAQLPGGIISPEDGGLLFDMLQTIRQRRKYPLCLPAKTQARDFLLFLPYHSMIELFFGKENMKTKHGDGPIFSAQNSRCCRLSRPRSFIFKGVQGRSSGDN